MTVKVVRKLKDIGCLTCGYKVVELTYNSKRRVMGRAIKCSSCKTVFLSLNNSTEEGSNV